MKEYRQKKKLEKQSLQLKQILELQNDNCSRNMQYQNVFGPPRKKHRKEKNKDVRQHDTNVEDSASDSEFQAIISVVNQRYDNINIFF